MPYLLCSNCRLTEYTAAANWEPDPCPRCGGDLVVADEAVEPTRGERLDVRLKDGRVIALATGVGRDALDAMLAAGVVRDEEGAVWGVGRSDVAAVIVR